MTDEEKKKIDEYALKMKADIARIFRELSEQYVKLAEKSKELGETYPTLKGSEIQEKTSSWDRENRRVMDLQEELKAVALSGIKEALKTMLKPAMEKMVTKTEQSVEVPNQIDYSKLKN